MTTMTLFTPSQNLATAQFVGTFAQKATLATNLANALGRISSEIKETIRDLSEERTKRIQIHSKAQILLDKLHAETEVIRQALEQDMNQRREVLHHLFQNLDFALSSQAPAEIVHAILQSILEFARVSSLQDLSNFLANTDLTRTLQIEF